MSDLAESLVARGVSVTAIAGRGRYNGGERLASKGEYRGAQIIRAWSTSFGKSNIVKRLIDYFSFYVGAFVALMKIERHDLIMVLTTPPLIGLVAVATGRLRRMPVVSLVQDIYPDVAVALGTIGARHPLTVALDKLNVRALNSSDRIIVLGECMRERVQLKLNNDHAPPIDVIHNWADGKLIKANASKENDFTRRHNLEDKFVVMFSGNFGHVNDFETVLEAARQLKSHERIVFLFIGAGAKQSSLEGFIKLHDLPNARILPYQPRGELSESLAAADAHLVTLAAGLAGLSVPSKTYGILAAGRPVLFVGDARSDAARIVRQMNCGAVIETGDGARLAATIAEWADNPVRTRERGLATRNVFERFFSRQHAVESYLACFRKTCEVSLSENRESNQPPVLQIDSQIEFQNQADEAEINSASSTTASTVLSSVSELRK